VTLISGKFMSRGGGYIDGAIAAVEYFTDLKARQGLNIVALNNSWGVGDYYSAILHGAIIRAANVEILFIAAAATTARITTSGPATPRASTPRSRRWMRAGRLSSPRRATTA
jgi:hypothetical protein